MICIQHGFNVFEYQMRINETTNMLVKQRHK